MRQWGQPHTTINRAIASAMNKLTNSNYLRNWIQCSKSQATKLSRRDPSQRTLRGRERRFLSGCLSPTSLFPDPASVHLSNKTNHSFLGSSSSTFLFPKKDKKMLYPIWIVLMYNNRCAGGTKAKLMVWAAERETKKNMTNNQSRAGVSDKLD